MSDSKSTEETRGLVLEDILQKVFRAGIGFERGESMMENSHFKMTPQHALKEIETLVAKRVEEARIDEARYWDEYVIGSPRKVTTDDLAKKRLAYLSNKKHESFLKKVSAMGMEPGTSEFWMAQSALNNQTKEDK